MILVPVTKERKKEKKNAQFFWVSFQESLIKDYSYFGGNVLVKHYLIYKSYFDLINKFLIKKYFIIFLTEYA